ncbi:hypothetical protein INR49_014961, partial [Caranx melampygus]
MLIIIHILLMLKVRRCTEAYSFETKTVDVGESVNLTCTRQKTWHATNVFWVRIVSGTSPETLGGTLSLDYEKIKKTHHMTAKQE